MLSDQPWVKIFFFPWQGTEGWKGQSMYVRSTATGRLWKSFTALCLSFPIYKLEWGED